MQKYGFFANHNNVFCNFSFFHLSSSTFLMKYIENKHLNHYFCKQIVYPQTIVIKQEMKILSSLQLRQWDKYTIENEPISSIDLMERASMAFCSAFMNRWQTDTPVIVFAGYGNNGGDALAISRILAQHEYQVETYLFNTGSKGLSNDCEMNRRKLMEQGKVKFIEVTAQFVPPRISAQTVVIDGLFGTGISRPLTGGFAAVVKYVNAAAKQIVAIDVPSGLMTENNDGNIKENIIRATHTFTFQCQKLAFLYPENQQFLGHVEVLDIGLLDVHQPFTSSPYSILEKNQVVSLLKKRPRFAHKGSCGHALLVAGKKNMAGCAVLSARACMRTGVGKLTVHTQEPNRTILQLAVPEAILDVEPEARDKRTSITKSTSFVNSFSAVGIGPGIGTDENAFDILSHLFSESEVPMVLDADALNIIAAHPGLKNLIPPGSILTPHKGELARLLSPTDNSFEQMQLAMQFAQQQGIYIIAKDAYTAIITPEGMVHFNTIGNAGMATAGCGDVLTGIILSLLAQGYSSADASILGVYLHALAGDIVAEQLCQESLIASDIIDAIPQAFKRIRNSLTPNPSPERGE